MRAAAARPRRRQGERALKVSKLQLGNLRPRLRVPPPSSTPPHRPAVTTDTDLIARAAAGDDLAMRALWAEHAPRVDAVVRRLVRDVDEAADIAQEVWIQIFRALPTFRGDAQFSTWAHRIAVNRTLNALRRARRLVGGTEEMQEDTIVTETDPDRPFVREQIDAAVAKLPQGARTVFVLHDVEGFTHEEIAEQLGITSGGSKSQLFKARARLRVLLASLMDSVGPSKDQEHVTPLA
jgi:RNA polymerase sigma-70 factor, ECF subfamily